VAGIHRDANVTTIFDISLGGGAFFISQVLLKDFKTASSSYYDDKFRTNERMNVSFHAQRVQPKLALSSFDNAKLQPLFLPYPQSAKECKILFVRR